MLSLTCGQKDVAVSILFEENFKISHCGLLYYYWMFEDAKFLFRFENLGVKCLRYLEEIICI